MMRMMASGTRCWKSVRISLSARLTRWYATVRSFVQKCPPLKVAVRHCARPSAGGGSPPATGRKICAATRQSVSRILPAARATGCLATARPKALLAPDYHSKITMHLHGLGIGFLPRHFASATLTTADSLACRWTSVNRRRRFSGLAK